MQRLRIGYLAAGQTNDVLNWSGLTMHIRDALAGCGHEIFNIDGLLPSVPFTTRLRGWRARFIDQCAYGYDRDIALAQSFARLVEEKIAALSLDCIVSAQTYPTTMLHTDIPVASWCDATFHALMGVYPGFDQISADSIRQGHALERRAIGRAVFLAYSSRWAAQDAVNFYGADPDKVAVIPFGANCAPAFRNLEAAESALRDKTTKPFRMLFVGRDWQRKGGPLAIDILAELRRRRINAELWVIGCNPFHEAPPVGVRCFGHLDKSRADDLAMWRECFSKTHVLLVPTRAECFGVVFAEAAAFALPSIATDVGGVSDAVADGRSGFLFSLEKEPIAYADLLQRLALDRAYYQTVALNAFRHYETTLNWQVAARSFTNSLLRRLILRGRMATAEKLHLSPDLTLNLER
jgi:glycosyltransferase involved in cell wall biosynthesis